MGWSESDAALQFAEYIRASITQDVAMLLVPEILRLNVWDDLPRVSCPTLVVHRPGLPLFPAGLMERVTARIPNAQMALLDGSSAVPWVGDWRALPRAIHRFLDIPAEARVEGDVEEPVAASGRRAGGSPTPPNLGLTDRETGVDARGPR